MRFLKLQLILFFSELEKGTGYMGRTSAYQHSRNGNDMHMSIQVVE